MKENIEKEYKVLLTKDQFDTLCTNYQHIELIKQVNTYYDTPDLQIRRQQGSIRIREKEGSYIFTLKKHTKDGLYEYEKIVEGNHIKIFQDEEIQSLLSQFQLTKPLVSLTSLTTYRGLIKTEYAEICLDHNIYHNQEDYEIEYEYTKEHDGLTVFQNILKPLRISYQKNCISKSKRALISCGMIHN